MGWVCGGRGGGRRDKEERYPVVGWDMHDIRAIEMLSVFDPLQSGLVRNRSGLKLRLPKACLAGIR